MMKSNSRMAGADEEEKERERRIRGGGHERRVIFTYGTLKKGFSNHALLHDMISSGDAAYLGIHTTLHRLPLICGPYRVPFLLDLPGFGHQVTGELYSVSAAALDRMDELEGTSKGHYQRLPICVQPAPPHHHDNDNNNNNNIIIIKAEAYYAHKSYAEELWKKNGEIGFKEYTAIEAKGYVKRKERQPPHFTFLDHIRLFLSSSSPPP